MLTFTFSLTFQSTPIPASRSVKRTIVDKRRKSAPVPEVEEAVTPVKKLKVTPVKASPDKLPAKSQKETSEKTPINYLGM